MKNWAPNPTINLEVRREEMSGAERVLRSVGTGKQETIASHHFERLYQVDVLL